jgi:fructosamine-3-kinase
VSLRHERQGAVLAKTWDAAPAGFFEAEERGLHFLRVPGGPAIADIVDVAPDRIDVVWIEAAAATPEAAIEFGRRLATLHLAAPASYGADFDGFIGPLPLPNGTHSNWPQFYAERRLAPYLDALGPSHRRAVEVVCERIDQLAGPTEPPARIHGDLWSGNLVWGADGQVWLIDAASAHGGHRETDLAMLALFGVPHLDLIVAGYDDAAPLADGWRDRVGLHQLHPLLVHAALFGGSYADRAASIARSLAQTS